MGLSKGKKSRPAERGGCLTPPGAAGFVRQGTATGERTCAHGEKNLSTHLLGRMTTVSDGGNGVLNALADKKGGPNTCTKRRGSVQGGYHERGPDSSVSAGGGEMMLVRRRKRQNSAGGPTLGVKRRPGCRRQTDGARGVSIKEGGSFLTYGRGMDRAGRKRRGPGFRTKRWGPWRAKKGGYPLSKGNRSAC